MNANEQALMEFVASLANGDDRIEDDAQHDPKFTLGWNQAVNSIAAKAWAVMVDIEKRGNEE